MALLPVAEALARILDGVAPTPPESIDLLECAGRVLAEPVRARLTQPPFDASAMDGYAVRRADVAVLPATLEVIGEAAAGRGYRGKVAPGTAVRIFTGAPVPAGADAIVIQENVEADGARIRVIAGLPDAAHIRPRGGDFAEGAALLEAGRRLDPRALTLAAGMGHGALSVRRRPRVAILATGDELVPPGTHPGADQIVSSNPVGIAAMVSAAGGEPVLLGIARDSRVALAERIAEAAGADVLVTIGGASVGDHDLVAPALAEAGVEIGFWRIAMRPGKPLMFGRRGHQRVLGLPGNPVSSLVTCRVFVVPLIERLLGTSASEMARLDVRLAIPLAANGPRTHYMRATLSRSADGSFLATPLVNQDSSLMAPLAAAGALIVREVGAPGARAGDLVQAIAFDF